MQEPKPIRTVYPVYINVSGMRFETRTDTLNRYPHTLLGNKEKRMEFYSQNRNEYFFNRNRESFECILFFYQSAGKLCRPLNIELNHFVEECEFFQLPEWSINLMKLKEGGVLRQHMRDLLYPKPTHQKTLRMAIWNFMENPSSSKYARWFAYFYVMLLCVSIVVNCLITMKDVKLSIGGNETLELIDISINSYFLIEFVVKLMLSPSKFSFFNSGLVWIDVFALIPFVTYPNEYSREKSDILFLKPFQMFRIIRICRLSKIFPGINVTTIVLKSSFQDIKLFAGSLIVFVTFAGAIEYNLEHLENITMFISIPESMYWAVQTCATLGYGDIVPQTLLGKLFASLFIFIAIPILSIPVMSVIIKFSKYYEMFSDMAESGNCDGVLTRAARSGIIRKR